MKTTTRSRVRRWAVVILAGLVVLGGLVASLPWIVGLPAGRRMLAAYANSVLKPGSVEFSTIQASWFRPTVVHDVTLRDAEGDAVLVAPSLEFEWGLWQILVNRPKAAHVNLAGVDLDIERRADGTIDLHETLKPVMPEHPRTQILVHLKDSHLRLRDPLLGEPVLASALDVDLDLRREYEPISWKISMASQTPQGQMGRLEIEGSYSRARVDRYGRHDTKVSLKGMEWPFTLANARLGIQCRGALDGTVDAELESGLLLTKGDAKLNRVEMSAPILAQAIRIEALSAGWNVRETESGWTVDQLALDSSLVSLHADGAVPAVAKRGASLEANINLADLAPYLPKTLGLRDRPEVKRSALRVHADLKAGTDGITQNCDVRGTISDLIALQGRRVLTTTETAAVAKEGELSEDVVMSVRAKYDPRSEQLDLPEVALTLPLFHVDGAGSIRDLGRAAQLDLKGTLNPDWDALTARLADRVEPNARISGQPRPWRVSASFPSRRLADALETVSGDLGIQIDELDVFGMRLGHAALVARAENGDIRLDPIDATLNQGALHLEPDVERDKEGHRWLRLGESSHLDGAVINDEVSHRVLSYGAPILDGATRVKGRISATLTEAVFPIIAPSSAQARVAANLRLDNVRFVPGRLAEKLLLLFDADDHPLLVLRDSVAIRIEDRKVHQKGMIITVADLASIALDGSVDFDKNLDLVAGLTMNRSAPIAGVLPPALQNARVDIPIRGTMQNPQIDTHGFKDRLAEMGKNFVGNSLEAGLDGLQRVLRGKPLKDLGGFFLPRSRRMSPPSGDEDAGPKSNGLRQRQSPPPEPEPGPGRNGKKEDTDGSGE
jgi:hypothetical protein